MIPKYTMTLREEKAVGSLEKIQNQIDSIAGGGQGKMCIRDRAKLHVRQSDVAKVYVYVHGGNCKIESEGNVMVRYKKNGD